MLFTPRALPGYALLGATLALLAPTPVSAQTTDGIRWRTDYNTARKEAVEAGKPMLLEIGSDNCFYCKKLQATTLQDAAVVELLNARFIPLRLDAQQDAALVQALRVQMYPTTVLAGPDGKIHGFLQGYVTADQLKEHAQRTVLAITTPDWVARDLQEANRAIAAADYTRAVTLLKAITKTAQDSPARTKADQVLAELEQSASNRLARVKVLEAQGEVSAATDLLTEVVRTYAGTQAATDAAARLTGLAGTGPAGERLRNSRARDLLACAREEFRMDKFADCLEHCEQIAASYSDLPEASEATVLAAQVKSDPQRLATACDQIDHRAAALNLALADVWLTKGDTAEATRCLEKVARLWPSSQHADQARTVLAKLQKGDSTSVLAGFTKSQ